jgi:hypothetical protein
MTFDDEHVKVIRTSAHLRSNNKGHCQRPDHTSMSAIDEGGMFHGEANRILGTKMRQGHLHPDHRSRPSRTTTKPYCSSKTINYIRHGSPIVLQGSPTSAHRSRERQHTEHGPCWTGITKAMKYKGDSRRTVVTLENS